MPTQDHLFKNMLLATAPLLVWAAHFFFSYAFVAAACVAGLDSATIAGMPILETGLLLASMLALGTAAALLWRPLRRVCRRGGSDRLIDTAKVGSAMLALIGIAWTSLPMLMLKGCN
jgi:hypothetical protein